MDTVPQIAIFEGRCNLNIIMFGIIYVRFRGCIHLKKIKFHTAWFSALQQKTLSKHSLLIHENKAIAGQHAFPCLEMVNLFDAFLPATSIISTKEVRKPSRELTYPLQR